MNPTTLARICAHRLAGAVRTGVMVLAVVVTGLLMVAEATGITEGTMVTLLEDPVAEVATPGAATCAAALDTDKDTADREFTSPPAVWLALGPRTGAQGSVRLLTPQHAAAPPQRPPRLAA